VLYPPTLASPQRARLHDLPPGGAATQRAAEKPDEVPRPCHDQALPGRVQAYHIVF